MKRRLLKIQVRHAELDSASHNLFRLDGNLFRLEGKTKHSIEIASVNPSLFKHKPEAISVNNCITNFCFNTFLMYRPIYRTMLNYLLILLSIIMFSCKKYIDMKIPDKGRKPVINCMFYNDSVFIVQVFESRFILDDAGYQPVDNAFVTISENGIITDTLTYYSQGYYKSSNLIPQIGKNYSIGAAFNGSTATGEGIIPSKQIITNIDTLEYSDQHNDNFRFNIKINDPENETNYYMLKIEKVNSDYYNNNIQIIYSNSNDPSIETQWQGSHIINDNLFNGKSKTFSLDVDLSNLYNYNNEPNKFYISLYSISKDFYLYAVTSQAQQNNNGSPFSEPVMVYNNIKNGYGIFAGASIYRDSIIVPSRGSIYPMK